jgi:citrate synthase
VSADAGEEMRDWWRTCLISVAPGEIRVRGYPIEELIGCITFPQMIWLMLRGELPSKAQSELLTATLVAAVDHGPLAPSIAIARMAATCGVGLNSAMASAINVLGDTHGGAGQECMQLHREIASYEDEGVREEEALDRTLDRYRAQGRHVPGYGHRFHPEDPRAVRLLRLVDDAAGAGTVSGRFARIGRRVERWLEAHHGKSVPMNIDGASAVIFSELGFEPPLGRGLFVLSRSVGILAHAWEQMQQGGRIKGPVAPSVGYSYVGPGARRLEDADD